MKPYARILLVVLAAAAALYFWSGDEETAPGDGAQQASATQESPIARMIPARRQTPAQEPRISDRPPEPTYGGYPRGYPDFRNGGSDQPLTGYRFRPLDRDKRATRRYQPYYLPFQVSPNYAYGPSPYRPEDPVYDDFTAPSETMGYQFRPMDEKRQDRRWRGNHWWLPASPEKLASPSTQDYRPALSNPI